MVPPNKKWRISNEFVSLIHSVISGVWALYAILMFPDLVNHMNDFVDKVPLGLVCIYTVNVYFNIVIQNFVLHNLKGFFNQNLIVLT